MDGRELEELIQDSKGQSPSSEDEKAEIQV